MAAAGSMSMWKTVSVVLFWYISNVGVVMLNKQLISNFGFKYPVLLTLCHMSMCSLLGFVLARTGVMPHTPVKSREQMVKIIALALVFCLSIVLANLSLRYIPVSFNQAIGATTPAFTAVCSFFIQGRIETMTVYGTLVPVVLGVVIASGFEPSFDLIGFSSCIAATVMRALKTVLGGVLLSDGEKIDSVSLMLYMSPVAAAALVPAMVLLEPNSIIAARELSAQHAWFLPLLALSSVGAYFQNIGNFLVTKHTSPLTLQVLGNGKGVVAVVVSVLWFQNPVSLYGLAGYGVAVAGVIAYSQAKSMSAAKAAVADTKEGEEKQSDEEQALLKPATLGKKAGHSPPIKAAGEIKAAKATPGKGVMLVRRNASSDAEAVMPPMTAHRSAKGAPGSEPSDALGWLRQQVGLDSK